MSISVYKTKELCNCWVILVSKWVAYEKKKTKNSDNTIFSVIQLFQSKFIVRHSMIKHEIKALMM